MPTTIQFRLEKRNRKDLSIDFLGHSQDMFLCIFIQK
jgi:hypothetical protein